MALKNGTLNTRIQLKYDTLSKWQSSVFNGNDSSKYLKAGEIAIVTLAPNKEASPANTANQHPLLFKVGTGSHKFDDLPWASALAADVYEWAKVDQNTFLQNLAEAKYEVKDSEGKVTATYEFLTAEEVRNLIAVVAEDVSDLADNVYTKDETLTAEEIADAIANALDGVTGGENGEGLYSRMTAVEQAISTLDNTYATDKDLSDAVSAINEELGKKSGTGHKHEISDVNGLQNALDSKAATGHDHDGVYSPVGHNHDGVYSLAGHTHADLTELINGKSDKNHTHSYEEITNKPTEFNPTAHNHEISEVNGLTNALAGKADKSVVDGLSERLAKVTNVMDFVGTSTTDPTESGATVSGVTEFHKGDVVVYESKEFVNINGANTKDSWEEFGNTTAELAAIDANKQAIEAIYKLDGETESGVLVTKLGAVNEDISGLGNRIKAIEDIDTLIINCGTSTEVI